MIRELRKIRGGPKLRALPRSFGEAFGELLRDRFVQAILAAGLLLGALEMGFFG